jgi:hypothetical protein
MSALFANANIRLDLIQRGAFDLKRKSPSKSMCLFCAREYAMNWGRPGFGCRRSGSPHPPA